MTLFVGTSGWAYREWQPTFYPEGHRPARWLEHYATRLSACEINATFYRVQPTGAVTKWANATPEHFRFAAKAHRAFTHSASVAPRGPLLELLDDYFRSLEPLGGRLGALLLQFPRHKTRHDRAVGELLELVGQRMPFAAELPHESWARPRTVDRLAAAGGTLCVSDDGGAVPAALPPGPLGYVRLRADRYGARVRARWRALLRADAEARDIFVFTRHRGLPPDDPHGGLGLALWLERAKAGELPGSAQP